MEEANSYVGSSVSPYQAASHVDVEVPRGSPISESKGDPPPLPPKPKELLNSGGELPSQSGESSPFADPISEPPPSLRPGFINVSMGPASSIGSKGRKERKSGTRSMTGRDEDAYGGIY